MISRNSLLALLMANSLSVTAADSSGFSAGIEEGKAYGAAANAAMPNAAGMDAAAVPGFETSSPPQSTYYGNPSGIGDAAVQAAHDNEAAQTVTEGFVSRPMFTIDRDTDPMLQRMSEVETHAASISGAIQGEYSSCQPVVLETPHPPTRDTCYQNRGVETHTCNRGFSPNVGTVVHPQLFNVNRGSEVPTWTARTFEMNFTVEGTVAHFTIKEYQVDNYGQLWINGQLVYQNVLTGYGDMRHGRVTNRSNPDSGWYQTIYESASGVSFGQFYDDGCNWGCRGVAPNLDISRYIVEGDNRIQLVCANANGIGPCRVNIEGSAYKLVVLGSEIDNQCATLEARAEP